MRARHQRRLLSPFAMAIGLLAFVAAAMPAWGDEADRFTAGGLRWLASTQSRLGSWEAGGRYPTAMTALAGIALLAEGSTPSGGRYAPELRRAVDYLVAQARPNGLIGDPLRDDRYTYGHGFGMLFLSQVLGEEEDARRREDLIRVLTAAVAFTGQAQTAAGGWGYVSARDGNGFDEGSTTVTQVQGLRGCRNAGIAVPKGTIDKAVAYIRGCTQKDGGVQYSTKGGNGRPAITAAALACLYDAGQHDDQYIPRMKDYCQLRLAGNDAGTNGHWHYANFYYSQVQYREGGTTWDAYRQRTFTKLMADASPVETPRGPGYRWSQGYIGPVYTTALNLIMLQLDDACLPIYQR